MSGVCRVEQFKDLLLGWTGQEQWRDTQRPFLSYPGALTPWVVSHASFGLCIHEWKNVIYETGTPDVGG